MESVGWRGQTSNHPCFFSKGGSKKINMSDFYMLSTGYFYLKPQRDGACGLRNSATSEQFLCKISLKLSLPFIR